MLGCKEMEHAAKEHIHTARKELADMLSKAENFVPQHSSCRSHSLPHVSSMGCWIAMAFSPPATETNYEVNYHLQRKLLTIANFDHKKMMNYIHERDKTVMPTPKKYQEEKRKKSMTEKAFDAAMRKVFDKHASENRTYSIADTRACTVSIQRGWNVPRVADDLLYVRNPHPALKKAPAEPRRLTIQQYEMDPHPKKTADAYVSAVAQYGAAMQMWYKEKDLYDEHIEWLWMTNEVGEAAQRVRYA